MVCPSISLRKATHALTNRLNSYFHHPDALGTCPGASRSSAPFGVHQVRVTKKIEGVVLTRYVTQTALPTSGVDVSSLSQYIQAPIAYLSQSAQSSVSEPEVA